MRRRVRRWLLGGAALAAAALVAWILWPGGGGAANRGPLAPLAGLADGRWVARSRDGEALASSEFRWGPEGRSLHELERDADGDVLGETWYFWHSLRTTEGHGSLALVGVRADGTVREGILREDEERSIELRWNAFDPEGGGKAYRERIRFLDPDRFVRSLHLYGVVRNRRDVESSEQEVLVEERTFLRE